MRERRRALLFQPHMRPLVAYVAQLRERCDAFVPDFDPLDGGVEARVLLLFECPGAKTDPARGGSGFVSRNNDDPFAEAVFNAMAGAGVARRESVGWSVRPCGSGQGKGDDGPGCLYELAELLRLLSRLDTAILVGAAARARSIVSRLRVLESDAPSVEIWRQAALSRYDGLGTTTQRHFSELDYE